MECEENIGEKQFYQKLCFEASHNLSRLYAILLEHCNRSRQINKSSKTILSTLSICVAAYNTLAGCAERYLLYSNCTGMFWY